MKRTTKALIALSVFAVFSGLTMPLRDAHAADVVIDTQEEFDALQTNPDWDFENYVGYYLNDSSSDNVITYENINADVGLVGGWSNEKASNNNTLIVKNSTITKNTDVNVSNHIIGGFSTVNVEGGRDANNNKVIIDNSEIKADVFGGRSDYYGDASNNTVVISNSEVAGVIYGGHATIGKATDTTIWSGRADNNKIILTNDAIVKDARLYGGYMSMSKDMIDEIGKVTEDKFTKENNTLILDAWSGEAQAVRSFDNVVFKNVNLNDFVSNDPNTAKPILTINGTSDKDSFTNIIGTDATADLGSKDINIGLSFEGGQDINVGDTVRLVQMNEAGNAIVDEAGDKKIKLANGGVSYAGVAQKLVGELYFDETNNKYIDYRIRSAELNEQANVVNEGRAAAAAFLWQGDELISEALGQLNVEDKYGFETFAMVYGNDSRYGGTAHDLSINGWSGLVGVGSNNKTKAGDLAWAVYFENGYGNYDVTTSMNGISLDGDGSAVYNGGGIAARLTGDNGVYGEASLRAGLLKNDLDHGLQNQAGQAFGYESESNYFGYHLGVGKIFKLEDGASVDTYAKYYHSTVNDDSFTIDGDEFELDDIDSDRLRVGIRYNQGMDRKFNVYYGAAWEYEFSGESNGYAQGHKLEETSLEGSTIIGELGVVYQPDNSPWSIDAKLKGYGGQRDGYSGSILATYHF